ncbi:alpha/beta fold hydrolase [Youxingia wuxianensis]|uniref:Lysophospholipase n=1 Tax=Youxingia wuxianensis TaxID=2763678 RepID=A0A926EQ18_9FIRM|nr:alpha/beta hydrolase [Youxingia wuxianensis]MBC8584572.1 lysophospholipase [Youxingia wuxianensis]
MNIIVKQIEFKSTNGENTIFGWIYTPSEGLRGIVQICHGMAEHMGRYHEFMRTLAKNGYVACGIDQVGHGRSVMDQNGYGFFGKQEGFKTLVDDQFKFNKIVRSEIPNLKCVLLGHSMGSFVARMYACKYSQTISGLIICGTAKSGMKIDLAIQAANHSMKRNGAAFADAGLNRLVFGSFNDKFKPAKTKFDWLSRDMEMVQRYIDDSKCGFVFTSSAFHDLFVLISKANDRRCFTITPKSMPIYIISGTMDPVGDFGKGPTSVYNRYVKAGVEDIEMALYEGARHELLNELNRQQVAEDILRWLGARIQPPEPLSPADKGVSWPGSDMMPNE